MGLELPEDISTFGAEDLTELSIDVCEAGDAAYLKNDICAHPSFAVNAPDPSGFTPLQYAVTFGSEGCCQVLLACKANPSLRASDGSTCAHIAAQDGFDELLELLATSKADLDARMPKTGVRPLDAAIANRRESCVQTLLRHKCTCDYLRPHKTTSTSNSDGTGSVAHMSPLRTVASLDSLIMFQALLRAGADPFLHNAEELPTAVTQDLLRRKQVRFLDVLEEEWKRRLFDPDGGRNGSATCIWNEMRGGYPVFFDALYQSDTDMLAYLVERKANLELCDDANSSPLFVAVFENKVRRR